MDPRSEYSRDFRERGGILLSQIPKASVESDGRWIRRDLDASSGKAREANWQGELVECAATLKGLVENPGSPEEERRKA
jgi:hypothetical protein